MPFRFLAFAGAFLLFAAALAPTASANPHDRLKAYVHDMVEAVHATDDPAEQRAVMNRSLTRLSDAVERVASMDGLSDADRDGLAALHADLQDKLDELNGRNGFVPVPDGQLGAFADYVQQDIEQADRTITLSLTTALLILIILILIL